MLKPDARSSYKQDSPRDQALTSYCEAAFYSVQGAIIGLRPASYTSEKHSSCGKST